MQLLKEVAGTRVYENRREESLKIMKDTSNHLILAIIKLLKESKKDKIQELLEYIQERLSELDEEKKELENYKNFDRERRCLEYTLFNRESNF